MAHWAARTKVAPRIAGALLVAPADVERDSVRRELAGFAPIPLRRLPFPRLVVGSTNDSVASAQRAVEFAKYWESELVVLDNAGHINPMSDYHRWKSGLSLLACFVVPGTDQQHLAPIQAR